MILALTAYLGVGQLLALWMSTAREADDLSPMAWAFAITCWPIYMAIETPAVCHHWLAMLRAVCRSWLASIQVRMVDLEMRIMKRVIEFAVRRVKSHGWNVDLLEKESEDGTV